MRIVVIAVGNRMPSWVDDGFTEYARRLPSHCRLELVEIPPIRRTKNADLERIARDECARIRQAIPAGARVIALERTGRSRTTADLAHALEAWLAAGQDTALLVGGPEGLAPECLQAAHEIWSLSGLTLAHPVVRVVLAEQIYRAWSILHNLPYHR